ncbi:hypothetical protein [Devosia sp. 1566]|uniref:hypothetical protein n=1 Tax=Devosia sp. 1566 TaxID=2499144 RepID=UPI0019D03269|nr:hypothetical protein [Devosia sp. 1566]
MEADVQADFGTRLDDWQRTLNDDGADWLVIPWLTQCARSWQAFEQAASGTTAAMGPPKVENWSAVQLFAGLAFYGRYGALLEKLPRDRRPDWVAAAIGSAEWLVSKAPPAAHDEVPTRIIVLAAGRQALDLGAGVLEPKAVGLLGNLSEGRVRNLMSGQEPQLTSVQGRIPAAEALRWLSSRPGFWPSIWQEEQVATTAMPDRLRVPQAADGGLFHPGLRRRNGYTIGAKGSEVTIEDFDTALKALAKMSEPRWRRPNEQGNWGIVRAVAWVEIDRRELSHQS